MFVLVAAFRMAFGEPVSSFECLTVIFSTLMSVLYGRLGLDS